MSEFKQTFAALVPERDRSALRSDDVYSEHPAWGAFCAYAQMQDWRVRDDAAKFVPKIWCVYRTAWSAGRASAQASFRAALGME